MPFKTNNRNFKSFNRWYFYPAHFTQKSLHDTVELHHGSVVFDIGNIGLDFKILLPHVIHVMVHNLIRHPFDRIVTLPYYAIVNEARPLSGFVPHKY